MTICFAIYDSFLHAKIVFDVRWIISRLIRSTYISKYVSHRNVWLKSRSARTSFFLYDLIRFTIFLYWFQNAFHIKNSIKSLSRFMTFSLKLDETYRQSSCVIVFHLRLLCQCRRDISKITNFCLIWIARNLIQWTNSNFESRRHCLQLIREYAFAQSFYESDSRTRALSVLLYCIHRRSRLMHNRE